MSETFAHQVMPVIHGDYAIYAVRQESGFSPLLVRKNSTGTLVKMPVAKILNTPAEAIEAGRKIINE